MDGITLLRGDSMELIKNIPDGSVELVLTDPPYNIGKEEWDEIENYTEWCLQWLKECERVLIDTGSLYFWHNDMSQLPEIMEAITKETGFVFRQMCSWIKPHFRKIGWGAPSEKNTLRNWFNICEYCLYYVKSEGQAGKTGLKRINSDPSCYGPLKEWYAAEKKRLGLTDKDIGRKYTEATGRKPYMLHHYFQNFQFEIPTREVWEGVYVPLGFEKSYEALRESREALRPTHSLDHNHCNVWVSEQITGSGSPGKNHICEKPVDILERIIRTSTRPNETVLDIFMGSGSTGVACVNTGRKFIGIEIDGDSFEKAKNRIQKAESVQKLAYTE